MALKFDRQYLEEHRQSIQNAETFGAAVADAALRLAIEKIGDGQFDSVEVSIPVTITPRTLRRSLSSEEAAALGALPGGQPQFGWTIDCVSVGINVPPVSVAWHISNQ
jgi:hypothetical protein